MLWARFDQKIKNLIVVIFQIALPMRRSGSRTLPLQMNSI